MVVLSPAARLALAPVVARAVKPRLTVPEFWVSQSHSTIRTQYGVVPFAPFDWQREFVWKMTKREIILKSRDVGSSEICVRWFCWRQLRWGGNILIKADKHDNAKNLVAMARHYLMSLPTGERPNLIKDNETELELEGMGTIRALARGGGRSERCRYLLLTERAFWEDSAEEMAEVSGALVAKGWQIVESTANGFNEFHGLWAAGNDGYQRTFVPRTANPNHDEAWWIEKQSEMAATPGKQRQEYPVTAEDAFVASGSCLFDTEAITDGQKLVRPPIETQMNGAVKIWKEPVIGRHYVAGADPAEGKQSAGDLDYSALAIYDAEACEHVADLHGRWTPEYFAALTLPLCQRYNNVLLGVERNNHGHAMLLALRMLSYKNLYWHQDPLDVEQGQTPRPELGWPTTSRTKPLLEQELGKLIASRELRSYDSAFWDECLTYVNLPNGSTGAVAGKHDDRVIAHGIALQMRHVQPHRVVGEVGVKFGKPKRAKRPNPIGDYVDRKWTERLEQALQRQGDADGQEK